VARGARLKVLFFWDNEAVVTGVAVGPDLAWIVAPLVGNVGPPECIVTCLIWQDLIAEGRFLYNAERFRHQGAPRS